MGNKKSQGRLSARRAATFLAALGVLVMSSGVALMVAATPANATPHQPTLKDWVCKYTGKPGVDEVLKHGNDGLVWVDSHATQGSWFKDGQNNSFVLLANAPHEPKPDASGCPATGPELGQAVATATPIQPTCENPDGGYTTHTENAHFTSTPAAVPGGTVHLTATADPDYTFDGSATLDVAVKLDAAPTDCGEQNPPQLLATGTPSFTEPTCTTPAGVTLPKQVEILASRDRTAAGPAVSTADANGIHYVASGSLTPGGTVDVVATLIDPVHTAFAEGATQHWSHTFANPTGCATVAAPTPQVESNVVVSPPKAKTPKAKAPKAKVHAATVTPTVVEAGLASTATQDLRGEQGLALVFAGMVMLLAAGGLGLRVRGVAARI